LTHAEARAFYDRFGARQDTQGFYEDPALDTLVGAAGFGKAGTIFEFGCGTGRLAERLLREELDPAARYVGCDISPVMTKLARERLSVYSNRVAIFESGADVTFPFEDASVDRVISTYVLDLLREDMIRAFLSESRRVLSPNGLLCLVSLTNGKGLISAIVSAAWKAIYRVKPVLVGGCRPISLTAFVDPGIWDVRTREIVAPWGIASEILVAELRASSTDTIEPKD